MAGKGNPKGSNGGGGPIRGQRRGETKVQALARMRGERAEAVASQVQGEIPRQDAEPRQKLGKQILEEAANYFFSLAAKFQTGSPDADPKQFDKYLEKAADIAGKLTPYQSPRLSSIAVTQIPLDLTKLTGEELDQLERLHAKAAVTGGNQGGEAAQVH